MSVDVVGVMATIATGLRVGAFDYECPRAGALDEASAAVAELIDAGKVMDARYRNGGTTDEWAADLARFRAALARCGGAE